MRALRLAALALLAPLLAPLALGDGAHGSGGVGVTPTDVDFGDVLREEPVLRSVVVQNARDGPVTVTVEPDAGFAEWIDAGESRFTLQARSTRVVELSLAAPSDAPAGAASGRIVFTLAPPAELAPGSSGVAVAYAVPVAVRAHVHGDETVKLVAGGLAMGDAEAGGDLVARLAFENHGNVRLVPIVRFRVSPALGGPETTHEVAGPEVRAGETADAILRVPAPALAGQYLVTAETLVRGERVAAETALVDVLEAGSLARRGEMGPLQALDLVTREPLHRLASGRGLAVRASFTNVGEADVEAELRGYVALEGRVVQEIASEKARVAPGETVELVALVRELATPGTHAIVGRVHYDGKVTPEHETRLTVEPRFDVARIGAGAPAALASFGALALVAAAAGAGLALAWRKMRPKA